MDNYLDENQNNNNHNNDAKKYISEKRKLVIKLTKIEEKCFMKFNAILINIIKDENIKKLIIKCETL